MRSFRNSLIVLIASFALAITANAQLGRKTGQPPAAAATTAATPASSEAAQPTQTSAPASGLTPEKVRQIVRDVLPAPVDGVKMKAEILDAVSKDLPSASPWSLSFLPIWVFLVVLGAIAAILWRRSGYIVHCRQIIAIVHDIVDPALNNAAAANRKLIASLAKAANIPMDQVDPEGAKAERIGELQVRITDLESAQNNATKAKKFELAGQLEKDLEILRHELDDLQMPRETGQDRTRRLEPRGGGFTLAIAFAVLAFAVHPVHAAPICYNTETGKTPGTTKVAIAVVNSPSTFGCAMTGTKVELVDSDHPATVVLTPTVTKKTPLTFEFTPTSEGRLIVKVDGRLINQLAVRSQAIAEGINDAVDLIGGSGSSASAGVDTHARMFIEGLACGASPDPGCIVEVRKAWGKGKGSSALAGVFARNMVIEKIFKDDRFVALKTRSDAAQAQADALKVKAEELEAKIAANTNTGGVTEARVGEIVDGKIAPLTTSIQAAQATGDQAKIEAGRAKNVAQANATVTAAMLDLDAKGKKLPKATATEWQQKLEAACTTAGVTCTAPAPASKPAKPVKKPAQKKADPADKFGAPVRK